MENLSTLSKKQQIDLINKLSYNLACELDNLKWNKIYTDYLKENIQEEKNHDNFRHESIKRGLTITEAGKLFAVQQIAEYLNGDKMPDVSGYLHIRKSVFTAYAIFANYRKEIEKAFQGLNWQEVLKMDYCFLIEA